MWASTRCCRGVRPVASGGPSGSSLPCWAICRSTCWAWQDGLSSRLPWPNRRPIEGSGSNTCSNGVSSAWFERFFDSGVVRVRTHALLSITCSIERLIERGPADRNHCRWSPLDRDRTRSRQPVRVAGTSPGGPDEHHDDPRGPPRPASDQPPGRTPRRAAAVDRPSTLRLTRRGRVVVLLLGLVLALAAGVFLGAGSVATERPGTPEPTRIVQVGSGDTLWGIAVDAAAATGEDDVRAMVDRIERLNALDSGMVLAGQRLRVPTEVSGGRPHPTQTSSADSTPAGEPGKTKGGTTWSRPSRLRGRVAESCAGSVEDAQEVGQPACGMRSMASNVAPTKGLVRLGSTLPGLGGAENWRYRHGRRGLLRGGPGEQLMCRS